MSGWDTTEAVNGGGGDWNDGGASNWNDGGDPGTAGFTDSGNMNGGEPGFTNQDARGDVNGEVVNDGKCHNCGGEGHMARDCEEPRKMGACFNCGEEGHSKVDCVKPRVFTGECNDCGEKGHQARDCPKKTKICRNCLQEGHEALECKNPKSINDSDVPDKTKGEAWAMLTAASEDRDLDDFKDALKILHKAVPSYTYQELEKQFRDRKFNIYIIAMEKDIGDTWTNVSLQGEVGKKYAVGYYYNEKPQRPSLKDKWPSSPEENMERLADAGTPLDRGVEKCGNCGEVGHLKRACPQELVTVEMPTVSCALCGEEGHRVRDCTQERQKPREPRACKVCEATDHIAKDCPNREKRTCRNCGSEDHMAKECDIKKCRNCDSLDHEARDCTAPKDWSRVKCRNCGEMGHTVKRCPQPIKENENAGGDAGFGNSGFDAPAPADTSTAGGDWNNADAAAGSGHNDWEKSNPTVAVGGGSGW